MKLLVFQVSPRRSAADQEGPCFSWMSFGRFPTKNFKSPTGRRHFVPGWEQTKRKFFSVVFFLFPIVSLLVLMNGPACVATLTAVLAQLLAAFACMKRWGSRDRAWWLPEWRKYFNWCRKQRGGWAGSFAPFPLHSVAQLQLVWFHRHFYDFSRALGCERYCRGARLRK